MLDVRTENAAKNWYLGFERKKRLLLAACTQGLLCFGGGFAVLLCDAVEAAREWVIIGLDLEFLGQI
jgi:hypothetical protein